AATNPCTRTAFVGHFPASRQKRETVSAKERSVQDQLVHNGYFRLFNLPAASRWSKDELITLGEAMHGPVNNPYETNLAAGYVYLAQFLVHDLTHFDQGENKPDTHAPPIGQLRQLNDPSAELDSLYGKGFADSSIPRQGSQLLLGTALDAAGQPVAGLD